VFLTYNCSEIHLPKICDSSPEIQYWPFTYTLGGNYWFYAICKSSYNDDTFQNSPKNFLVSTAFDVKGLMENPDVNLSEIYLVSPSHMNGGDNWRMDLLKEAQHGLENVSGQSQNSYIYITESGETFIDSASDGISEIHNVQTLFTFGAK